MTPPPGETAVFGFVVAAIISGDYRPVGWARLQGATRGATNVISVELLRQSLTVWGVPADPSHDAERGNTF